MVTLANLQGGSLALDLTQAFGPAVQEGKARREQQEVTDLVRQASGLPPVPDKNAGGFLAKVAPGLANTIQQLNQKRSPDEVDQARNEAQIGLETSKRILAAKTPAEKQKIILERASEVQQAGGDTRELLRMSNLTPAEIDLQAQKTAMTSDAALKTLPAPTDQERLAARAELAVRNPQALNAILRQEAADQQAQQFATRQALVERELAQKEAATAAGQELVGQVFGGGGAALPNDPLAASTQLIAGFEGFRETPYFDVNALRTGFGSDTVTLASGEVVPVTEGTVVTQEDALRDLERRITTEFAPRAREAVTPEVYDSLSPQQQAALNSITYNYGSLPERVASVARTGDIQATAQAIAALGSDNEGINANRRAQEAQIFAGGGQQQPQQISQQEVATLLANPNVPDSIKDFAIAEYERQIEQQQQEPTQFDIREGADGFLYYVDPTAQTPARRVNPEAQKPEDEPTAAIQEYQFAVEQGFPGTLIDFQQAKKGQGFSVTTPDGTVVQYGGAQQQPGGIQPSSPDAMISSIEGILDDPALESATGIFSFLQAVPGTPQRRFGAKAAQLEGQAFLQAFESLKGAGQITEIEGLKATQAIGRLDTAQSPEDYRAALTELRDQLVAAKNRPTGWINTPEGQAAVKQGQQEQTEELTDEQLLQKYGG